MEIHALYIHNMSSNNAVYNAFDNDAWAYYFNGIGFLIINLLLKFTEFT